MSFWHPIRTALYTKLTTTSALTTLLNSGTAVYSTQAPDDATLDYVVFSLQAGAEDNRSAHRTGLPLVFVRGYSSVGETKAGQIDTQIDLALHMKPLTITGWGNCWIAREQSFSNIEVDVSNFKTWMAGAYYRLMVEKT